MRGAEILLLGIGIQPPWQLMRCWWHSKSLSHVLQWASRHSFAWRN